MRSLSAILSRSAGHDALLELLELGDDVAELQKWIGQIWNLAAADARLDAIFPALAQAQSVKALARAKEQENSTVACLRTPAEK